MNIKKYKPDSFLIRNILFILVLGCYFLPGQVFAQNNLSLADAIKKGLENNYQIRISEYNVELAKNNNAWGTVGRFPAITAGLNQANRFDDMPGKTAPGTREKFSTNSIYPNINLSWILFNGFAVNISKQKLELLEQFSEGNATVVVENTIQGIVLAYYKVLLEQEKLKVMDEVKKLSGDRYNYILHKKEFGNTVTYDVLQAKNAFLSDSTNFLLQKLNLKNALLNLHLLLGEDSIQEYILTDEYNIIDQGLSLDDLLNKMKSNNKSLRNQYINLEILKKDISFQKSGLYPTLAFSAGYDYMSSRIKYEGMSAANTDNYDYYANFSLSFNLFNGGNTKRAIQNAMIEEKIGELTISEIELGLTNQLTTLFELYEIRHQLYQVAQANLESAALNMQISEEKFKSGAINSFNFRDVQLIYLNVASANLEAIYNLIDTYTELMRITGGVISEY